ncbi:hypothetical protein CEXT_513521 [Caerostris extrusa]|uniref:G-protein coupled receptors family 1 profile domain-containing protein n=1 Tax=Caerostris extrusa TaxID=172846 RepID=A0AAV4U6Y0_CAEEX|nr:hypothetical protein CEXT_513521 [Caerostris extrusa]
MRLTASDPDRPNRLTGHAGQGLDAAPGLTGGRKGKIRIMAVTLVPVFSVLHNPFYVMLGRAYHAKRDRRQSGGCCLALVQIHSAQVASVVTNPSHKPHTLVSKSNHSDSFSL